MGKISEFLMAPVDLKQLLRKLFSYKKGRQKKEELTAIDYLYTIGSMAELNHVKPITSYVVENPLIERR